MSSTHLPPPIFVGEHRALDFLNSVAVPVDSQVEWLGNGRDLLQWLEQAGLADSRTLARFRDDARDLDAVAVQARELREWFRGFVRRHAGKALAPGVLRELESLNRLLAADQISRQLIAGDRSASGQALQWSQLRRWTAPEQLLQPIAEAMGDLLCHADFHLIRACEGPSCTLLFLDTTKGHARRWCSMSVCGNRAKVAAHRARQRAEKS